MPLQATSGAASYDAFGGGVPVVPNYIEECFSCFLYTGNGSTQTITNGIDLSTKGGLVWYKDRTTAYEHQLVDTVRGAGYNLETPNTSAQASRPTALTAFNTTGFTLGSNAAANGSGDNFVSWTFRKQPKFFDVVTYTGNGASSQAITHNLGSTPGCVIVKRTDSTSFWLVWHRGFSSPDVSYGYLNSTDPFQPDSPNNNWAAAPTSTTFTPAANYNVNGATYVAYLFAHDAGGFGLSGTDNVISCGSASWSGGSDNVVNLGYETQWVMYKSTDIAGSNWIIFDTMRGMSFSASEFLRPNLSNAAVTNNSPFAAYPTATGFTIPAGAVSTGNYIYIAIRRGPMKVPTDGTKVFAPIARTGTGSATTQNVGLNGADLAFTLPRTAAGNNWIWVDRLRGGAAGSAARIQSNNTSQEFADQSMSVLSSTQTTISYGGGGSNGSGVSYIVECFKRAPGFFDEVCYTGNGSVRTLSHNLGVTPELMIVKGRSGPNGLYDWPVYSATLGATKYLWLNTSDAENSFTALWNNTAPTASVFTVGTGTQSNQNTATYVAYLFATCAGVSKVGSYTGNGSSQTINCGFTSGSRLVLIKRTDSTGNWTIFDSARGIVSGNDPALYLNSTSAEVTSADAVDTDSTGFVVNQEGTLNLNVSSATYIFLSVA
jgi:hypothetical protein